MKTGGKGNCPHFASRELENPVGQVGQYAFRGGRDKHRLYGRLVYPFVRAFRFAAQGRGTFAFGTLHYLSSGAEKVDGDRSSVSGKGVGLSGQCNEP